MAARFGLTTTVAACLATAAMPVSAAEPDSPPGVLVDTVIAVVDKEVITHSELMREARVALVKREGEQAGSADLPGELLSSFRDYLINQTVVAARARRVGGIDVSEQEVDQEVSRFAQRFHSSAAYAAFLRRFDISEQALRDMMRRDLRCDRYIEQRMRAWRGAQAAGEAPADVVQRMVQEMREGVELRLLGAEGELELQ